MWGSTLAMENLHGSTRKSIQVWQHTVIGEDPWPEVSSWLSSVSTCYQEEQTKHQGDEIHTNVHEFPLLSRCSFEPILPWAKTNLPELVHYCLEYLTIEVCLVCHVSFPKQPFRLRSLIRVMRWSIRRFHCSWPAPCLLMMVMDWAIAQTPSLTLLSIRWVVKAPLSCQIPMVSDAHWLSPTPAFSAQMQTCRVGIWIVLASATTDFGNQRASHYIVGSQQLSMIEWWISNAGYSKQVSGMLNISSRVMRSGSRGDEGVSKVLEIVSKVGRQGEYMYRLGGFSWSSDFILAAIQLGHNLLHII